MAQLRCAAALAAQQANIKEEFDFKTHTSCLTDYASSSTAHWQHREPQRAVRGRFGNVRTEMFGMTRMVSFKKSLNQCPPLFFKPLFLLSALDLPSFTTLLLLPLLLLNPPVYAASRPGPQVRPNVGCASDALLVVRPSTSTSTLEKCINLNIFDELIDLPVGFCPQSIQHFGS